MGEIDSSLIEVARPFSVKNGLRVNMMIYINRTRAIDTDISGILGKHVNNGEIAVTMKTAWNLKETPNISKLKVQRVKSRKMTKHSVELGSFKITADQKYTNAVVLPAAPEFVREGQTNETMTGGLSHTEIRQTSSVVETDSGY